MQRHFPYIFFCLFCLFLKLGRARPLTCESYRSAYLMKLLLDVWLYG
uniref:Uncharacterized protein n=1 Tax=Anguilla anguilla TaxID=7936 RepID=A0A0E9WL14_ANGAN